MRLVYVYLYDSPEEGRQYLFRRPLFWAWLLYRFRPEYDYALFWFDG